MFNKKGDVAYLIGELDGSITVLGYNNGNMRELQRVQTSLPRQREVPTFIYRPTANSSTLHTD